MAFPMVTSSGHISGLHSFNISCNKQSDLFYSIFVRNPDLRSFKWEIRAAVLDQVGDCGTNAVGQLDQAQRLQVGVEKSLIEEIQWAPLQHKVFPGQQVSLLQQRI